MGTKRLWTCLGLSLIVATLASSAADAWLFGLFGSRKKKEAAVPKHSLVVFPFDQVGVTNVPDKYGDEIAAYLRTVLAGNPKYSVFLFSDRLSPIKRGKEDSSLKTPDYTPPFFEDKAKTLKLAQLLAADFYIVGSVDSYEFDPAQKVAQITLSAQFLDAKTGKLIGNYIVAGKADQTSKASDEAEFRAVAAGKAVDSLKAQILPAEAKPAEAPAEPAVPPASETAPPANEPAPPAPPAE